MKVKRTESFSATFHEQNKAAEIKEVVKFTNKAISLEDGIFMYK